MNTTNTNKVKEKQHTHEVLCNKIKNAGYKVFVTYNGRVYGSFINEDGLKCFIDDIKPLHELRLKKLQNYIYPRGGSIKAVAVKGETIVAETEVYCSERDNFCKAHGLTSCYGKLYSQLVNAGLITGKQAQSA